MTLEEIGSRAKAVSRTLNNLGSRDKNIGLEEAARALLEGEEEILAANPADYEKAERKESEMGIYEERLQEVSIYGERSSEISSGRSCHLRSSRLSVLSEPAGTAVYASPAGTFSENTEKEMHCSPEKKSELSVP